MEKLDSKKIKTVCQLSSLHYALDTRIFYKYAIGLRDTYNVIVVGIHPKREIIKRVEIVPFREFSSRRWRIFTSWILMFFKAIRLKADLYHIHDPELIPCALLLKLFGKKVVMDVHENFAGDIFDKEWVRNKKITFKIFDFVERTICKKTPVVLAESSYLKRYQEFAPDITVIQNYVEPEFFEQFIYKDKNPLHLYYIGIILESRCITEIMDAMYVLHQQNLPVHFHCVGRLYSRIEQAIHSHQAYSALKEYLHFYGRMNLEEGYKVSMQCGIGLCLIKPMKNSIESKPTKLFEYMACGIPIITSNFPLYVQLVDDTQTGITVNPISVQEIANAIKTLIQDSTLAEKFGHNGLIVSKEKFNWAVEHAKLLSLYARILN